MELGYPVVSFTLQERQITSYREIPAVAGIPITFDSFHHNFFNIGESKLEAALLASSTWKISPACFHFSSSCHLNEEKSNSTAHTDWIYEEIVNWNNESWIMVESSVRDIAVLSYLNEGVCTSRKIDII